jgi:hypothetical protein
VPCIRHSAKTSLSSANWQALDKFCFRVFENSLPSVTRLTLGKDYFAECHPLGTRQSIFYFANQTFCGMFLNYVDLHVAFWDNYKSVFYNY